MRMLSSKVEKSIAGLRAGEVSVTRQMLPTGSQYFRSYSRIDDYDHLTLSGLLVTLTTAIDLPVRFPEQLPDLP
jgi:hypothetical protein